MLFQIDHLNKQVNTPVNKLCECLLGYPINVFEPQEDGNHTPPGEVDSTTLVDFITVQFDYCTFVKE